jgi:hypothetical protein
MAFQLKLFNVPLINIGMASGSNMSEKAKRDLIARMIEEHKPGTVGQLAALAEAERALDEETLIQTVKGMVRDGSLKLEGPKYPIQSFPDYLFTLGVSSWFWATMAVTALAAVLALTPTGFFPVDVLRWGFGSLFLLFLPGYSFLQLIFPKQREMRKPQRYIFSIAVSLAIVIMLGLVLNYSGAGIRLATLLESIGSVTVVFAVAAAFRLYLLNRACGGP